MNIKKNDNIFDEVLELIVTSKVKVFKQINSELISLYWDIGEYISNKIKSDGWGKNTVKELSDYIFKKDPNLKGFSQSNIWRMKQFYEEYKDYPILAPLVRQLTWTNNLLIFSKTKTIEEKEFYLNLSIKERYSKRELERQIDSAIFERSLISSKKLAPLVRESTYMSESLENNYSNVDNIFRDKYLFEFLDLPQNYSENDLKKSLVSNMKKLILEIGRDFTFVGEEFRLQVGNKDFYIDLLFYHRELQCLVAFELKIDDFKPEYLGQLNFYLEALDRDIKKTHEKPSVGVLLCKTKDDTVVEYAISKNLSPALIAEYETKLINKRLLQNKIEQILEN